MKADRVRSILREIKGYQEASITADTSLVDHLNFTSMDVMNAILQLEQAFAIAFRDEDLDLDHFATFGNILTTLAAYDVDVG